MSPSTGRNNGYNEVKRSLGAFSVYTSIYNRIRIPKATLTRIKTRIMCCMAYYTYKKNKKAFMTENNKILHEIIKKNVCKIGDIDVSAI